MKKDLLKTAIISLIIVGLVVGCIYYILPNFRTFKGICEMFFTWFSVSLIIDLIKTIVIYVSAAIKKGGYDDEEK